ncbi:Na+/H+ antiporter [Parafrankia sp. EUN1f]|uniref:Na+/H+ antiporter n=1 Tax=Parafrankia sp. EUN1f TaxID=102897 RepID=UPI0001C43D6F|nr:Na+/H+ antiporter [Parafrankia sp. EUN1f]EFC86123.1 Na+/H+ antiporter [Parafrankia sp. EUN1f]
MLDGIAFGLLAMALVVGAALAARRFGLPAPVLLVGASAVYTLLPGPDLRLEPDIILVLVIPPLLFSAALGASLLEIRANRRAVISLSVLLVVATTLVVGGLLVAVVPGLPFAAACALGAALAPPDAVSALSIGRRVGLPDRLRTVIEGESLLNDATALTLYTVAVAAVVNGPFDVPFDVPFVIGRFLAAVFGGFVGGIAVAWLIGQLRRRIEEPVAETAVSLATPFAAYLPAEAMHASGVLAVATAGLVLGHQSRQLLSGAARLHALAVWRLVDLLLEGFVFLLIGQQFVAVVPAIADYSVGTVLAAAAVTIGGVLLTRVFWLLLPALLPTRLRFLSPHPHLSGRELVALSWSGMRGVISLAAVFALPLSTDAVAFPHRDLLLFCAYSTVLLTLVGQGLTFGPLLRRLGVRPDADEGRRQRARARAAAAEAGLRTLRSLQAHEPIPDVLVERLSRAAEDRKQRSEDSLKALNAPSDEQILPESPTDTFGRVRRAMIEAERDELQLWRDSGQLSDISLRHLENELDHEEGALPPP